MNSFGLAFKTYKVDDFDGKIKVVAGGGARISSPKSASEFSGILQERGFLIFPSIDESSDGYVRVFRANSVIASLLSAFRYPGSDGDGQRGGPRNWDSLLRWDPDQGEGVWNTTAETELSC